MRPLMVVLGIIFFISLIAVHEFGHFSMAKILGVNVYEFSIGMGPALFKKKKGNTFYSLRAVPLGGFCSFEDQSKLENIPDDDEEALERALSERSTDPRDFINCKAWEKILILTAGPLFNIVFAIILLTAVYFFYNGMEVSVLLCFKQSLFIVGLYFVTIFEWIKGLFTGGTNAGDVSGLVGIVSIISEQAKMGIANLLFFIGELSINLGIMNLLPIPALDGGRIIFTLLRIITRGKFTEKAETVCNSVGMVLLVALMIFLIIRDTVNLF